MPRFTCEETAVNCMTIFRDGEPLCEIITNDEITEENRKDAVMICAALEAYQCS